MAYIVNISDNAAVTINLQQGRVQLNPKEYAELSPLDVEPAKKNYNSKEFGLCVVETEQELRMIVPEQKAEESEESEEESVEESVEEIPDDGDDSQDDQGDQINQDDHESEEQESDDQKENNQTQELTEKAKAILDIKAKIDQYRAEQNLNDLKELATKLNISYMYNISFEKLAEKILMHIGA